MGTTFNVTVVDVPRNITKRAVRENIEQSLKKANKHLSNWDNYSEISIFNRNKSVEKISVSPTLFEVLSCASDINRKSFGYFDTTISPLVETWGFGAAKVENLPPLPRDLADAMKYSGKQGDIKIGDGTIQKSNPNTEITLAGIGKGHGADLIARGLSTLGIRNFLIEIGGDLVAKGNNPAGLSWQICIEQPEIGSTQFLDVVEISNLGMASSGDYKNFFERDGVKYSHIIDPNTGSPVTHGTAAATVLAGNAMIADAWATALLTIGCSDGIQIANDNKIAVLFAEKGDQNDQAPFRIITNKWFDALRS